MYLKYLYKFETLVPFEVLPLRLDAAIPTPLPMLETLSKIFQRKRCQGPPAIRVFKTLLNIPQTNKQTDEVINN